MPATPAGQLSARIVYQRASVAADEYNEDITTWGPLGGDRAKVLWGAGSERREAGATQAAQAATFRVRSNARSRSVTVRDRIYDGSADWNITAISPIDCRPAEIEFTAVRA